MQENGDDGTAGGGGRRVCKVDWRDEKEKGERWSQSVGAHVRRPSSCHPSVR